jgi:hypothetical protein
MELKEFLIKDYEFKLRFLTDHFSRMWTRFNFFLAAETAIVSGKVIFTRSDQTSIALLVTGLIVSILWYLMSAEDKFLVDTYRAEVKETYHQLTKANEFESHSDAPLYHAGQVDELDLKHLGVKGSPLSWRIKAISTTRLGAVIALLSIVCWSGWLIVELDPKFK